MDTLKGLWNSITATDVDNDGKTDYILGNLGLNSFYKGFKERPFEVYANDFDGNGSFDAIPFLFLKGENGNVAEYPAFTKDDLVKQLVRTNRQFLTYKVFAAATVDNILSEAERKKAIHVSANFMQSAVFKNLGNGKFKAIPLPYQAQWSPIYGVLADDFNNDGKVDILVNTNDYGTEVNTGQYDALNGMVLLGKSDGSFDPQTIQQSGIYVPLSGRSIVKFIYKNSYAVAIAQNQGPLKIYKLNGQNKLVRLKPSENIAEFFMKNGSVRREEVNYGNSFLSQSSRFIKVDRAVVRLRITGKNKQVREINY